VFWFQAPGGSLALSGDFQRVKHKKITPCQQFERNKAGFPLSA